MQLHTSGDKQILMMAANEIDSVEGGAAAKAALAAGQGLTTNKLAVYMVDAANVKITYGKTEQTFPKTAAQVVDAIRAYKTPERILAALAI